VYRSVEKKIKERKNSGVKSDGGCKKLFCGKRGLGPKGSLVSLSLQACEEHDKVI